MAYTKQTWADLPSKTTPINASRLSHIEQGIYDAANTADNATTALGGKVDKVEGKGLSTNDYSNDEKTKLEGIAAGAEVNVQSDWNQSNSEKDDFIKNKPTLGTSAALDVPESGNASLSQVVKGDDSRLSDSRTPTSHTHTKSEITDFPTLGTAAAKNSTNSVTENSTDLVESGATYAAVKAVQDALDNLGLYIDSAGYLCQRIS